MTYRIDILAEFLAIRYYDADSVHRLLDMAEINVSRYRLDGAAIDVWLQVLVREAADSSTIPRLLRVVLEEYPHDSSLEALYNEVQEEAEGAAKDTLRSSPDRDPLLTYRTALRHYCSSLPEWFPPGSEFTMLRQSVSVSSTSRRHPDGSGTNTEQKLVGRLTVEAVVRQHKAIAIVGEPGSGKSWTLRSLALSAMRREATRPKDQEGVVPVLALAPRLERELSARLASRPDLLDEELAAALVAALPEVVTANLAPAARTALADEVISGRAIILIDGYDEIGSGKNLARFLGRVRNFARHPESFMVLTTRPSHVPPRSVKEFTWSSLQPLHPREQREFVDTWFRTRPTEASKAKSWLESRNLDAFRMPLMLALYCAVVDSLDGVARSAPNTEHEVWERALVRLASDEDRGGEVSETDPLVAARLGLLTHVARSFRSDNNLLEEVEAGELEGELSDSKEWQRLAAASGDVIGDLVRIGVLQRSPGATRPKVRFLHNAFRDYLLAQSLSKTGEWAALIPLLWSHPAWEPVVAYLGGTLDDPSLLCSILIGRFADDPLNTARLVAARAVASAYPGSIPIEQRVRIRDELLIMLASHDSWDRMRAATALPGLDAPDTQTLVARFIHPSVPTRVITSALQALAVLGSRDSLAILDATVRSSRFTDSEREMATDAIVEIGATGGQEILRLIGSSAELPERVRASAVLGLLRAYGDSDVVREWLSRSEGPDGAVARLIAERLALDPDHAGDLRDALRAGSLTVSDPYCQAVLLAAWIDMDENAYSALLRSLPNVTTVARAWKVMEELYALLERDRLWATFIRYLLDSETPFRARWSLVDALSGWSDFGISDPIDTWIEIMRRVRISDSTVYIEFLASESIVGPSALAGDLQVAIREKRLPDTVAREAARLRETLGSISGPTQSSPAPVALADDQVTLPDALGSGSLGTLEKYRLMRRSQSQLPDAGPARIVASQVTHAVSAVLAVEWIDALPHLAPGVEARLDHAGWVERARVDAISLRARWPGREDDPSDSVIQSDARLLDVEAEAALLHAEPVRAAELALASIGLDSLHHRSPRVSALEILFAESLSRGDWERVRVVERALPGKSHGHRKIRLWHDLLASPDAARQLVRSTPSHLIDSDPEILAIRLVLGEAEGDLVGRVISWAGATRAKMMLDALGGFEQAPNAERIRAVGDLFAQRSRVLAEEWPLPDPESPSMPGVKQWQRPLVSIAAKLLAKGLFEAAATVAQESLVYDSGSVEIRNILGFCQIPIDLKKASHTLRAAAEAFRRPFAVNTANRMLVAYRLGDGHSVLELGREFLSRGTHQYGTYLWDIDEVGELRTDMRTDAYIVELARRSALLLDDPDEIAFWQVQERALAASYCAPGMGTSGSVATEEEPE